MSHPRRSRTAGPRARSHFRALQRRTVAGQALLAREITRGRNLSIRRGQVWTSLVRIAADARAEEYRARMMREADEHATALALAVADEEICACRLEVLRDRDRAHGLRATHPFETFVLARVAKEVDYLRATAPKVPPPRPGAERFETPLVRDKATAHAVTRNKYASAPAGTRAEHKRPLDTVDAVAREAAMLRAARCADREERQRFRRTMREEGCGDPHYMQVVRGALGLAAALPL